MEQPLHRPETCAHCQTNRRASTAVGHRPSWIADAVFYQIFPDRFARSERIPKPVDLEPWDTPPTFHGYKGGDLLGIVEHLDWLTERGITAVYLNPIFRSASNHRYHTYDYYSVDPLLGGDDAFDELLASCHARGVRVVLDGVFNHASRGFFPFHDVLENGGHSPYVDWFHISGWPLHPHAPNEPANYEAWWGLKALPKLNTDNPEVREYLMDAAEHWVRQGIDGWRLDVPEEIKTEGFWEEFRIRMRAINPDLYLVGEVWGDASPYVADGTRFDGTMNYQFTAPTIAYAVGDRLDHSTRLENPSYAVAPALDGAGYRDRITWLLDRYPPEAAQANLNLLDSHDTARIRSIASGDTSAVALALVLLLTFPGAPCIYYGTEIGLEGGLDPDNRRAFPWNDEQRWEPQIDKTLRELISLRARHPALRAGAYTTLWPTGTGDGSMIHAFERTTSDERIVVAVNAGRERESHAVPYPGARRVELLAGGADVDLGQHQIRVSLAPQSYAVWLLES